MSSLDRLLRGVAVENQFANANVWQIGPGKWIRAIQPTDLWHT
jgi:hypothetical protein